MHRGEKPFSCTEPGCEKRFSFKSSLKSHISVIHLGVKPFECPEANCDKSYSQRRTLEKHIAIVHREERNFPCSECDRKYARLFTLQQHVAAKHRKEKRYRCTQCNARFSFGSALKQHVAVIHRDERPFSCDVCKQRFSRQHALDAHAKYCGGRKHSVCPKCSKNFSVKSDLLLHRLSDDACYSREVTDDVFSADMNEASEQKPRESVQPPGTFSNAFSLVVFLGASLQQSLLSCAQRYFVI